MKPIFWLIFTALTLGLTACSVDIALNTDADQVAQDAAQIADFEPPSGFTPEFSASLKGYLLVSYTVQGENSHLYLIQSSDPQDADQLTRMLGQMAPNTQDAQTRTTVLETRAVTLRGEETTLILSEGVNSEGDRYRQATAAFTGKGGPALVSFSQPLDRWNTDTVLTFLVSLR